MQRNNVRKTAAALALAAIPLGVEAVWGLGLGFWVLLFSAVLALGVGFVWAKVPALRHSAALGTHKLLKTLRIKSRPYPPRQRRVDLEIESESIIRQMNFHSARERRRLERKLQGRWIRIQGWLVSAPQAYFVVFRMLENRPAMLRDVLCTAHFEPRRADEFMALAKSDPIVVDGRIEAVGRDTFTLTNCELVGSFSSTSNPDLQTQAGAAC